MNDFLKRTGKCYASCLMQDYTYPPDSRTMEIEQFLSRMPNSVDYDTVESFFANRVPPPLFNRQQIRSITHYAQKFARRFREDYYCSLANQNVL